MAGGGRRVLPPPPGTERGPGASPGREERIEEIRGVGQRDLAGSPAEEADPFRIEWRHREIDDATGGEPFEARFLPRTLDNVPAGPVDVELTEVPSNCSASDATRSVDVPVEGSVSVAFGVTCT